MLRHSFATHVLDNGAEIFAVKEILGHASLASTQVYTNASIEQLKKWLTRLIQEPQKRWIMKITVQSFGLTPHAPLEEHIEKK